MTTTYTIKIQQFEGPFDLLLFFIERDELDIHDIPIAQITDDFLAYIRELEALNIDVASEFILVAATLMRIKTRLLLPRKSLNEEGQEVDPRDELVRKLIEYKKYKSTLDELRELERVRSEKALRGNVTSELKKLANRALIDVELESLSLFKLLQAFQGAMERYEKEKNRPKHTILKYAYTIQDQQTFILKQIGRKAKTSFRHLFGHLENRMHAIVTFLALLELLNDHRVQITQGDGFNNFWLHPQSNST